MSLVRNQSNEERACDSALRAAQSRPRFGWQALAVLANELRDCGGTGPIRNARPATVHFVFRIRGAAEAVAESPPRLASAIYRVLNLPVRNDDEVNLADRPGVVRIDSAVLHESLLANLPDVRMQDGINALWCVGAMRDLKQERRDDFVFLRTWTGSYRSRLSSNAGEYLVLLSLAASCTQLTSRIQAVEAVVSVSETAVAAAAAAAAAAVAAAA